MPDYRVKSTEILRFGENGMEESPDLLAVEEPLEIRLNYGPEPDRREKKLSVTMRTPGHDFDLAMGFLFAEGIIHKAKDIRSMRYCLQLKDPREENNVLIIELDPACELDLERLQRNFYTTSSCGVCGKSSIDALSTLNCKPFPDSGLRLSAALFHTLPAKVGDEQTIFTHTGGLHAAALFDTEGNLLQMREDIGRHNAVDKLIGALLREDTRSGANILMLSGRAGFELVQKALMAGIRVLAAVGAPSSLAVELAQEYNMTLLGFVRNGRFNVYSGKSRILKPKT
jgi:FdhD protein